MSSASCTEAAVSAACSTHVSAAESGSVTTSSQPTFFFTSAPMLGSPLQIDSQPLSPNVAAFSEDDESSVERQTPWPYDIPAKFSIVNATVKKAAITRLISNSLSLAAAIEETDGPAIETEGDIHLVRLQCLLTDVASCTWLAVPCMQDHVSKYMYLTKSTGMTVFVCQCMPLLLVRYSLHIKQGIKLQPWAC